MSQIRVAGIVQESIVDGPGIRLVVFSQGCPHHCPGCHNPETHDPDGGYFEETDRIWDAFQKNPMLAGITLSGGDPFMQPLPLAELAEKVRLMGKTVITYTGYTMEYLMEHLTEHPGWKELLEQTDILIDGPYMENRRSLLLHFRGSDNQRYIDPAASLQEGRVIEAKPL